MSLAQGKWDHCFLWMWVCFFNKTKKTAFVAAAAFNTGREEQISQCEIRSLGGRRLRQVNGGVGDIYHQTYCFAATEGREEGDVSRKASQNKRSYPPSSSTSGKMHCNNSILFIMSVFVFLVQR